MDMIHRSEQRIANLKLFELISVSSLYLNNARHEVDNLFPLQTLASGNVNAMLLANITNGLLPLADPLALLLWNALAQRKSKGLE